MGTTATKKVKITNTGATSVIISALQGSGNYQVSATGTNPCGGTPDLGASCTFAVAFAPLEAGSEKGSVTVVNSSAVSPDIFDLGGAGVLPVTFSPAAWTFTSQMVGTTSSPILVMLTNNQNIPLTISSITPSGDFNVSTAVSNGCGASVAALASCSFEVSFSPSVIGTVTGAVTVVHNANYSPQEVKLRGRGNISAAGRWSCNANSGSPAMLRGLCFRAHRHWPPSEGVKGAI